MVMNGAATQIMHGQNQAMQKLEWKQTEEYDTIRYEMPF